MILKNRWVVLVIVLLATAGISAALWSLGYKFGMLCCLLPLGGLGLGQSKFAFSDDEPRVE